MKLKEIIEGIEIAGMTGMENLDIPTIPEFIEMFTDAGGEVFACKLAMDMFKLTKDDLDDRVSEVLTVGEFYEKSAGASIIFT